MIGVKQFVIVIFGLFVLLLGAFMGNVHAELYMSVSGKVVRADTGTGLQGINVVLMSPSRGKVTETTSTAQGLFVLKNVPKGIYDLLAFSDDQFIMSLSSPIPVEVPSGKNVVGVPVKLRRGCSIKGRVISNAGYSIPQARIISQVASTSTDGNGYFQLKGISPGITNIGIAPVAIGVKAVSASCEAGTVSDLGDIIFSVDPELSIRGTIKDTSGAPVPDALILATDGTASAAYTYPKADGSFFITGINNSRYKLYVIAYGYDAVTLTDISVPSSGTSIVLKPASVSTSGSLNDRFRPEREGLLSRALALFETTDAFASGCNSCPEGKWTGVSADMTGILTALIQLGESFSVGRYFCLSSMARVNFTQVCHYVGATNYLINVGISGSAYYCTNSCCGEDLLGDSNGRVLLLGENTRAAGGGIDFSAGGSCKWMSAGIGFAWPSIEKLFSLDVRGSLGGFIGYRECNTVESVNIFEWYCSRGLCL
jgi:hypothetical protein